MAAMEMISIGARFYKGFGRLGERGPPDGDKVMVLPGFLANDRTTLGLQRALAEAGYRVIGWGMGLNDGAKADTLDRLAGQVERFGGGAPVMLVGWSLGGVYARELAKQRPELVSKVVTLGTPFSGNPRENNAWRLYELVAGHPVDAPPIEPDPRVKPPVPTMAIWSRRDGVIAPACARGTEAESDRRVELDCGHMAFGVSSAAYPKIIEAIRAFA
jgi:pimeloyl-ACP methyl ester carboxylesterase